MLPMYSGGSTWFFKGGGGRVGVAGLAENICWPDQDPNF